MADELNRFGIYVLAWCLMTNHTHLIVVPSDAGVLSRAIGEAHRCYTPMKNFSNGVRGYLFQGRFGSCLLDEHRNYAPQPGDGIVFRQALPGDVNEWHVAPRRQYVINLSGHSDVEIGDGTKLNLGPGDIYLADDTTGRGHISRV